MVRACVRAWMLMFVGGDCLGVRVRLCMPSKGEIVLPCMWLPVLWLTANHPPPPPSPFSHPLPVQPGGRLDTRFLIMVRGGGRYLDEGKTMQLSIGTHVLVHPGGDFTATG